MITGDKIKDLTMEIKDIINGYSVKELSHILNKVKVAKISENFKDIMHNKFPEAYTDRDDEFFNKYSGKTVKVYQWADDWWICEDDNYVIDIEAFEFLQ